ncbi:MAG: HAD hydrolase-like protein [Nitrososphaerales archaeon]|nr:HAD hydrolase-like protein [Nitrososphaerales archaeon]
MEGKSALKPTDFENFIFDLDGTLFTIPIDWAAVRRELATLIQEPIEGTPLFLRLQQVISGRPSLKESIFAVVESHELRAVASAKPMPGAVDLLYSLFEVSKLALVTLQGRRACDEILRRHKLADLFEAVITREDSLDRALQLEAALNRLGIRPRAALFAGDRLNDVVCARRVGVPVALVGREASADAKPDYTLASLTELKAFSA